MQLTAQVGGLSAEPRTPPTADPPPAPTHSALPYRPHCCSCRNPESRPAWIRRFLDSGVVQNDAEHVHLTVISYFHSGLQYFSSFILTATRVRHRSRRICAWLTPRCHITALPSSALFRHPVLSASCQPEPSRPKAGEPASQLDTQRASSSPSLE